MSDERREVAGAGTLRRRFDAAFAAAPPPPAAGFEDVLAIRLGGDPYVLRLSEIAGLHADRQIAPVPSAHPALLGIAALRGQLLPVYDLGALLGYARAERPRWFVVGPAPATIGLAFADMERPLRLPEPCFSDARPDGARNHVRGAVRVESVARAIVDVGSVLRRLSAAPPEREGAARNG